MRRVLLLIVAVALGGCGKKAATSTQPSRLVLVNFSDPKTFNPITAAETSSRDIVYMLFSGLTTKDQVTQEVKPALAESWSVDADQKTWTFKLRKDLHWSDGKPLTADDVIFTFNDVVYNPDIPNTTSDMVRVDKKNFVVTRVDDLTIKA